MAVATAMMPIGYTHAPQLVLLSRSPSQRRSHELGGGRPAGSSTIANAAAET